MVWSWDKDPVIMTSLIEDDSFYSFQIARNIAAGNGITFTEGIPTNGFQPLYVFLLVPIFALFQEDLYTPIHVGLTMLSIFSILTCAVLYKVVRKIIRNDFAALFAASFWAFNPAVVFNSIGGLEGAIEVFFVSLVILHYLNIRRTIKWKPYIILGLLFGIAILARLSTVILFSIILLDILLVVRVRDKDGRFQNIAFKSSRAFIAGVFTILVLTPWLLWSLSTFGTIAQSNVQSSYFQYHYTDISTSEYIATTVDNIMIWSLVVFNCFLGIVTRGPYPKIELMGIIGLIFLFLLFLIIIRFKNRELFNRIKYYMGKVMKNGWYFVVFALIIFLFYTGYLWRIYWRYFLDIILIGAVFMAVLFGFLINKFDRIYSLVLSKIRLFRPKKYSKAKKWKHVFILIVFIIMISGYNGKIFLNYHEIATSTVNTAARYDLYRISLYANSNTEPDAILGSFNSGIIGYFSNRTLINLDGLVNSEALDAMKNFRLYQYVLDENISYIVDYYEVTTTYLDRYSTTFDPGTDIELFHRLNATNPGEGDMAIFRVIH